MGRFQDAVADSEKAVEIGRGASDPKQLGTFLQGQALAYDAAGDAKKSLAIFLAITREYDRPGVKGHLLERAWARGRKPAGVPAKQRKLQQG